jgi:hypothetical protein
MMEVFPLWLLDPDRFVAVKMDLLEVKWPFLGNFHVSLAPKVFTCHKMDLTVFQSAGQLLYSSFNCQMPPDKP